MKTITIDNSLFSGNRERLRAKLLPNSLVILLSNYTMPTNADGTMPFKQNNNLFYLTGIRQEDTILLLYPDSARETEREILFVRETNEDLLTWEGEKLTLEQASEISGIANVMPVSQFDKVWHRLMTDTEYIYLDSNEHKRSERTVQTSEDRFIADCKRQFPLHKYHRLAPIIYRLRTIKSKTEIDLIKEACRLTESGLRRALKFIKPGVTEYEIEAEFAHEFISKGASFADYAPIIASGINSCVLHYETNYKECNAGDLVLMDAAAGYGGYNADLTRTAPVSGKFAKRQKEVYNSVLSVFRNTSKLLEKGTTPDKVISETEGMMITELERLGLLKKEDLNDPASLKDKAKKYYPHGVSHFLGLDVHDVGYFNEPIVPGMVFTCEPGIYIRDEGFGIRLENDILITEDGNEDLLATAPIEAEEIEAIMNNEQ